MSVVPNIIALHNLSPYHNIDINTNTLTTKNGSALRRPTNITETSDNK